MNRRQLLLAAAAALAVPAPVLALRPRTRITSTWLGDGWSRVTILMPWGEVEARLLSGDYLNLMASTGGSGHYSGFLLARDGDDLRIEFYFRPADWTPDQPRIYRYDMEGGRWT